MSPARATLLHSPGRKPWVICYRMFIEPQRGGTTLSKTNACAVVPLLKELLIFVFPVYPGFHFVLCRKSWINEVKTMLALPKLKTSAKSAQTSAVVCTDYGWSLQKVLRTYKFKCAYLLVENPHYLKSSLPFGQKALSLDHTITCSSIITPLVPLLYDKSHSCSLFNNHCICYQLDSTNSHNI